MTAYGDHVGNIVPTIACRHARGSEEIFSNADLRDQQIE
jgi:hypothetical protein